MEFVPDSILVDGLSRGGESSNISASDIEVEVESLLPPAANLNGGPWDTGLPFETEPEPGPEL